jgi:hypothetical protein
MSVNIANVNPAVSSFQNWLDKTNQALYVITTQAVTADLTTDGSMTQGNAVVNGAISTNTVVVTNALRGGTLTTPGNLTITTNTTIVDSGLFAVTNTNVRIINTNTTVNTSMLTVQGGSVNVASNTSIGGSTLFLSSANISITSDTLNFTSQANSVAIGGSATSITSNLTIGGTNTVFNSNVSFGGTVGFGGGLTVTGTTTLKGDVILGNTAANTISMVGAVNTAIIPDQDDRRDLGSSDKAWANLYVGTINATRVEYSGDLAGVNAVSTNTLSVGTYANYITYSNNDIGNANTAGVFTAVPVFTLSATEGRTIKLVVQARNARINTYSSSEMLLVHDGTTPYMTTYATLSTNTSAAAYEYTTDITDGNVRVLAQQPAQSGNTAIKVMVQYLES